MHKKCFMGRFYGIWGCFGAFLTQKTRPVRHENGQNLKISTAGFQIEGDGLAKDIALVPELLDEFLGLF